MMNRKYKLVRSLPELVDELSRNTDALHRRTRWLTVGLVVCGVELLLTSRIVVKQEEAVCELTRRVKELENIHSNGPVTVDNAEILDE